MEWSKVVAAERAIDLQMVLWKAYKVIKDILAGQRPSRSMLSGLKEKRSVIVNLEVNSSNIHPGGDPCHHQQPYWLPDEWIFSSILALSYARFIFFLSRLTKPHLDALQSYAHTLQKRLGIIGLIFYILEILFTIREVAEWLIRHFG